MLLQLLFLASLVFTGAGTGQKPAGQPQAKVSGGQVELSVVDDEENDAYNAAKREPDPRKRAARLFEFIQKYPKSELLQQRDFEETKVVEDEYNTYYAARQEPDFDKRSTMFIEYIKNHPDSPFIENINNEYMRMLKECSQDKKYELLESIAEKWLKTHPNDKATYAFIAEAARNLKHYQKCGETLEAMYAIQPSPGLAMEIHECYQKAGNLAKQTEWAEKLFKMPDFDNDYMLRYGYVTQFSKNSNLSKAAEYAKLTLKSASLVSTPDEKTQKQLRQVSRACYHVIGSNLFEKGRYSDAISAFEQALKIEPYGQGYYKIGLCLDSQKDVEKALLYYAMAELTGGEDAPAAKTRLETLYKALHNDTLIGIDKVYKKAKELLAEPLD